jgi:hypothetical protein
MKQYKIFDIEANIFTPDFIIEAKNSRKALEIYLKLRSENILFKKSGSRNVRFKVREIGEYKKACWYQII